MDSLKELFSDPIFQTINFIFAVIGLIASYIQIKSHFDQKRKDKIYETLFSNAETEWQGKYTSDQVSLLKEELSKLQSQISEEKQKIQQEIPLRAKEYFLKEQLYTIENNITELYKTSLALRGELNTIDTAQINKDHLDKVIEEEIRPSYLRNERHKRFVFISILLLVLINFIPYLFYILFQRLKNPIVGGETILLVIIEPLIILVTAFLLNYKFGNKRIVLIKVTLAMNIIMTFGLIISIAVLLFTTLLTSDKLDLYYIRRFDSELLQNILISIFLLAIPSYFISLTSLYFINNFKRK